MMHHHVNVSCPRLECPLLYYKEPCIAVFTWSQISKTAHAPPLRYDGHMYVSITDFTGVYRPDSNDYAERVFRTLVRILRFAQKSGSNWDINR